MVSCAKGNYCLASREFCEEITQLKFLRQRYVEILRKVYWVTISALFLMIEISFKSIENHESLTVVGVWRELKVYEGVILFNTPVKKY